MVEPNTPYDAPYSEVANAFDNKGNFKEFCNKYLWADEGDYEVVDRAHMPNPILKIQLNKYGFLSTYIGSGGPNSEDTYVLELSTSPDRERFYDRLEIPVDGTYSAAKYCVIIIGLASQYTDPHKFLQLYGNRGSETPSVKNLSLGADNNFNGDHKLLRYAYEEVADDFQQEHHIDPLSFYDEEIGKDVLRRYIEVRTEDGLIWEVLSHPPRFSMFSGMIQGGKYNRGGLQSRSEIDIS